jgi:PRTRC genetic system protein B
MTDLVTLQAAEARSWELSHAILLYTSTSQGIAPQGRADAYAYATIHEVTNVGRAPRLEAGVPATRDACAGIARALGAMATLGGFIPQNLLFLGAGSLIWWRPPGPARVFFDTRNAPAGDQPDDAGGAALIGEKSAVCPQPGLVFAVAGGRWYVYAVPGDKRPHPLTALWRAPYFNVWASGEICAGNVRLPDTLTPGALHDYERAFFDSRFTHPNVRGRDKLIHHADGPYGFWAGMLRRPVELGFPEQLLVGTKLNLERLAKRLETGERLNDE